MGAVATLPGRSRTIVVEPVEQPEPVPAPEPPPDPAPPEERPEPEPVRT